VTLTGATEVASSVQVATANGTATAGSDYTAVPLTTLNFGPQGTTPQTQTVTVPILEDTLSEPTETFAVNLSNALQGTLGATTVSTVSITDNEGAATLNVAVNPTTGAENNAGAAARTFTISLSTASAQTVTVDYALSGSATAGTDYSVAATTGTL